LSRQPAWLWDHARNVHSQFGEDGVIEKILQTLPANDNWCVELGAWDGVYLSNTRNLIENAGYSAVLIEGDETRFAALKKRDAGNERVTPVHAFVGFTGNDGLDAILSRLPIPADFDFLSIDVDGNDYYIWKAMSAYRPKTVCIEFNPTIAIGVRFVQRADRSVNHGNSLSSLVELAEEKGYRLVSVLPVNAFFVDAQYFSRFEIDDNSPETLRKDSRHVTHLFSGYDGTVFLQGNQQLPWHGLPIREAAVQVLPKLLRRHPDNYSSIGKVALGVFRMLSWPRRLIGKISRHLTRGVG
jgi:hypothetical protein